MTAVKIESQNESYETVLKLFIVPPYSTAVFLVPCHTEKKKIAHRAHPLLVLCAGEG